MKISSGFRLAGRPWNVIALGAGIVVGACSGEADERAPSSTSAEQVSRDPSKRALPPARPDASASDASAPLDASDGDAGTPAVADAGPVGTACETTEDCTTWSSYCVEAPCTCVGIARSGGSPMCAGRTVSCIADPCSSRSPVCVGGMCSLAPE